MSSGVSPSCLSPQAEQEIMVPSCSPILLPIRNESAWGVMDIFGCRAGSITWFQRMSSKKLGNQVPSVFLVEMRLPSTLQFLGVPAILWANPHVCLTASLVRAHMSHDNRWHTRSFHPTICIYKLQA